MKKLLSTAVAVGIFASTSMLPALADVSATALPSLNSATNATVTTSGANMNVQITGGKGSVGITNWNTYNIGSDASVNYEFTAHNQTSLNTVAATGGISQIYGKITDSGCAGCGYEATGKVILINPNGVLFGSGANVNLNSFTVSTLDGTYDEENNKLTLTKGSNQGDYGIVVEDGASIYGDKNVTFASNNIALYNGSKISTNTAANVEDTAYGKIKLVTADGVNFTYYNNGAVEKVSGVTSSTDKMVLSVNGELTSGNIDLRNYSTNEDSELNLNGATLKAVKAVKGNDGNIWLTASNKIVMEDSTLTTENADGAESRTGSYGDIQLVSGQKASVAASTFDAVGNVTVSSTGSDVVVDNSTITAAKDIALTAANIASAQNSSTLKGANITISGTKRGQAVSSTLTAEEDINISGDDLAWTSNATLNAGNDVNVTSSDGYLLLSDSVMKAKNNINLTSNDSVTSAKLSGSTFTADNDVNVESTGSSVLLTSTSQFVPTGTLNLKAANNVEINSTSDLTTKKTNITAGDDVYLTSSEGSVTVDSTTKFLAADNIYIRGAKDVKTNGTVDLNGLKTNITAGNDVNVKLANVDNEEKGLVAKAGNDMTVTTAGTLSVSSLISGNDMTINANKVIAGKDLTSNYLETAGDSSDRAYIEVGGTFTSNVTNDNYEVTASADLSNDGNYYQRHHIQYGDEKILLVNDRPANDGATDPADKNIDNGNEVDVLDPSTFTDTTKPSTPDDNTGSGSGDSGSGSGDSGSGSGDSGSGSGSGDSGSGSGDSGSGSGTDCDGEAADGDSSVDEDAPGLVSATALLNYASSLTSSTTTSTEE